MVLITKDTFPHCLLVSLFTSHLLPASARREHASYWWGWDVAWGRGGVPISGFTTEVDELQSCKLSLVFLFVFRHLCESASVVIPSVVKS